MARAPFRGPAVLAILIGLLAAPSATAWAAPLTDDSERIDAWVTERMDAHDIPGVAVAVVRGGRTVHLRGYGQADPSGRPVTGETPFLIGSASKPFTATVVRQLVDEGLLALDEPVWPHLAHLADSPPDGFEQVTVRHLLAHLSGLPMMVGLAGTVPIHTTGDALDRRVADVLRGPLASEPGTEFEYSNAGPMLLAAVVEQVTGEPFAAVLDERIFTPLGMDDSFATEDHPAATRLATGHRQWFGRWRRAELPYDPAGVAMGYIGSTAEDLSRFLHAHLDGHPSDAVPASAGEIADDRVLSTGWDLPLEANHGLGWFVDDLAGHRVVSHAGSLGHFNAHLIMVPEADGLGIAVLSNASAFIAAGHEGQYELSLGLAHLLLDQEPEAAGWSPLTILAAPTVAWAVAGLLLLSVVWHLVRTLPRWRREKGHGRGRHTFRRLVLPSIGYLALGAVVLLTVPLGAARHFYPDVGWGATVVAYLALGWGLLRPVATAIVLTWPEASPRRSDDDAPAESVAPSPPAVTSGSGHPDR